MPPRNTKGKKKQPVFQMNAQTKETLIEMETQAVEYEAMIDENRRDARPPSEWPKSKRYLFNTTTPKPPLILTPQNASQETIDAKKLDIVHGGILSSLKDITGGKDVSSIVNDLFGTLDTDGVVDIYVFLEYCKNVTYTGVGRNNPDASLSADDITVVRSTITIPDEFYNRVTKALDNLVNNLLNTSRSKRTSPQNLYSVGNLDEIIINFGIPDLPPPVDTEPYYIPPPTAPVNSLVGLDEGPSMNYMNIMEHLNNLINPPGESQDQDLESQRLEVIRRLREEMKSSRSVPGPRNTLVKDYIDTRSGEGFAPTAGQGGNIQHTSIVLDEDNKPMLISSGGAKDYTNQFQ
jgi:hypothetical protein